MGVVWGMVTAVQAQSPVLSRDPTLPPVGLGVEASGEGAQTDAALLPLRLNGANVVVRAGKPFLVVGSRLVAPGQQVESYTLVRITETEIWLRDASGVTKVPRFAGVQRQASQAQCSQARIPAKKSARKTATTPRKMAPPPTPKTGVSKPRPIRENEPHDC
jgi:hypothetical protein